MEIMHRRNLKSMHGAKRLMERGKYLKVGENGRRIRDTSS
jgi:hypothetical protein